MWPVLVPGQCYTTRRNVEPAVDDIVIAQHPTDSSQTIVKRIVAISEQQSANSNGSRPFADSHLLFTLAGTVSWSSTFTVTRPQIFGVLVL